MVFCLTFSKVGIKRHFLIWNEWADKICCLASYGLSGPDVILRIFYLLLLILQSFDLLAAFHLELLQAIIFITVKLSAPVFLATCFKYFSRGLPTAFFLGIAPSRSFTTNSLCLIVCPIHEWRLVFKIWPLIIRYLFNVTVNLILFRLFWSFFYKYLH